MIGNINLFLKNTEEYFTNNEDFSREKVSEISGKISSLTKDIIISSASTVEMKLAKEKQIKLLKNFNKGLIQDYPKRMIREKIHELVANSSSLEFILKNKEQSPIKNLKKSSLLERFLANFTSSRESQKIQEAKELASKDGEKISKNIKSYGITDQNALVEIAKMAAYQNPGAISKYIQNYGIIDQDKLVEIAAVALLEDPLVANEMCDHIMNYGITDPEKKYALLMMTEAEKSPAYIKNFGNAEELFEIAKIGAQKNPQITLNRLPFYRHAAKKIFNDPEKLFELGKITIQSGGPKNLKYITELGITSEEKYTELLNLAFPSVAIPDQGKNIKMINPSSLERFQENETEEMGGYQKLIDTRINPDDSWPRSISPACIFADSDLVLYPSDYQKRLPLNGIKVSELEEIERIYRDEILTQKIFKIEGSEDFQKDILEYFKLLLTRPTGRLLISNLIHRNTPIKILGYSSKSNIVLSRKKKEINLTNTSELSRVKTAQGKKMLDTEKEQIRTCMTLAHELIHFLHHLNDKFEDNLHLKPSIDPDYDSLEEQITISGWGKDLFISPDTLSEESQGDQQAGFMSRLASILARVWSQFYVALPLNSRLPNTEPTISNYDFINENIIRSEFSLDYRSSHRGIEVPDNLTLSINQPVSFEIISYLEGLFHHGLEKEFENFLLLNKDLDFSKIEYEGRPFNMEIMKSIFSSEPQSVKNHFEMYLKHQEKFKA